MMHIVYDCLSRMRAGREIVSDEPKLLISARSRQTLGSAISCELAVCTSKQCECGHAQDVATSAAESRQHEVAVTHDKVAHHPDVMFFFFFQAEDGIRDLTVTGVQTCALPICRCGRFRRTCRSDRRARPAPGAGWWWWCTVESSWCSRGRRSRARRAAGRHRN